MRKNKSGRDVILSSPVCQCESHKPCWFATKRFALPAMSDSQTPRAFPPTSCRISCRSTMLLPKAHPCRPPPFLFWNCQSICAWAQKKSLCVVFGSGQFSATICLLLITLASLSLSLSPSLLLDVSANESKSESPPPPFASMHLIFLQKSWKTWQKS